MGLSGFCLNCFPLVMRAFKMDSQHLSNMQHRIINYTDHVVLYIP